MQPAGGGAYVRRAPPLAARLRRLRAGASSGPRVTTISSPRTLNVMWAGRPSISATGIGTVLWYPLFPQMFTLTVNSVRSALRVGTAGGGKAPVYPCGECRTRRERPRAHSGPRRAPPRQGAARRCCQGPNVRRRFADPAFY